MPKKYQKFILIIFLFCLIGAGVFCFLNIQKKESAQTKTTPNLKLLTSHSHPEAGEKWVVSFETTGASDLTITPTDQDTISDLDLVSLKCGEETRSLQVLGDDVISFSGWQCTGKGELTHLVNIARKHTLKFQFGSKIAFAYNNPDSVTDSFTDTSKISATSSVVITGGQAKLATCGSNGTVCSLGSECCSNNCMDGYCCNSTCSGNCDRCNVAGSLGTCTDVNSDCAGTGASCYCSSGSCQTCSNTVSSCNCSGYACQACPDTYGLCGEPTCSSYACGNTPYANTTDCGTCVKCNGSGSCNNYYAIGTTDSTAPGTCTGTHYRCNGNGSCTAPCSATISCDPLVDPYLKCGDWCTYANNCCQCLTSWSAAGCTGTSYSCAELYKPYCKNYHYLY